MISEAFLLAKIPVMDLEMTMVTAQATAVMGLERVVAVVATKVAQVMDLRAVVAMDLALDPRAAMGRLAVAIMVEVMDQAVMAPHTKVDQGQARLAAMDPQAVVAMEVLAAAEAAWMETMEAMAVVAPVTARTVEVAVMGLEPVGAMDMVQLAAMEVLTVAAMDQADLPAAVATEQVQMAMVVMDPVAMVAMDLAMVVMGPVAMVVMGLVAVVVMDPVAVVVAATVKAIRCQTQFSPKAVTFFNVWKLDSFSRYRRGGHRLYLWTCSETCKLGSKYHVAFDKVEHVHKV